MKHKLSLDDILKNKLQDYRHEGTAPDWLRMKDLIDRSNVQDQDFDLKIKDALADAKMNSAHANWAQFKFRRDLYRKRQKEIISARVIESCLLLLLIWTINRIALPHNFNQSKNCINNSPIAQNNSNSHAAFSTVTDRRDSNDDDKAANSNEIVNYNNRYIQPTASHNSKLPWDKTKLELPNFSEIEETSEIVTGQEADGNMSHFETLKSDLGRVNVFNSLQLLEERIMFSLSKPFLNNVPTILSPKVKKANHVDHKVFVSLTTGLTSARIKTPFYLLPSYIASKEVAISNPLTGGEGKNAMFPAVPNDTKTEDLITRINGLRSELNLIFDYGQHRISTGLHYSQLNYEASGTEKLGSATTGFFLNKFKRIESHFIHIPVLLHKRLFQLRQHNLYVLGGLDLQIGIYNHYSFEQEKLLPSLKNKLLPSSNNYFDFSQRNFVKGISQGGSFYQNSLMNYMFGLSYHYRLSSHLSLMSNVSYHNLIGNQTYGPNLNKIQSLNWQIGTLFTLR